MTIANTFFPPANREAAAVAFIRTVWQSIRATSILAIAGGVTITAGQVATINWPEVGYAVAAIVLTGALAGSLAAGDILTHGLPDSYVSVPVTPVVAPAVVLAPGVVTLAPPLI
jgi:hypothetical protein